MYPDDWQTARHAMWYLDGVMLKVHAPGMRR